MANLGKTDPRKSKKEENYVVIDYPKEGEIITSPNYTIRIGASEGNTVEVSIDAAGSWNVCRLAEGYWWYDWANYSPGFHLVKARMVDSKGKVIKESISRGFRYQPQKS